MLLLLVNVNIVWILEVRGQFRGWMGRGPVPENQPGSAISGLRWSFRQAGIPELRHHQADSRNRSSRLKTRIIRQEIRTVGRIHFRTLRPAPA